MKKPTIVLALPLSFAVLGLAGSAAAAYSITDAGAIGQLGVSINEAGQVAGTDTNFAFRFTPGGGRVTISFGPGLKSEARGMNANSVVGKAQDTPGGVFKSFLWVDHNTNNAIDAGELQMLPGLGGKESKAHAI